MSTERATAELDSAEEFDRRDQILGAANECFTQLGIRSAGKREARDPRISVCWGCVRIVAGGRPMNLRS